MTTFDEWVPGFQQAKDRWPKAPNLTNHYIGLRRAFENDGHGLIELSKSFLETVCITVLTEMGKEISKNQDTTYYVKTALSSLGIENTRGASAFDKVLSAYNKLADALSNVRNQEGSVAHGKDGFIDSITTRHSKNYLLATDTILHLILEAFDGTDPHILHTRESHERFLHLCEKINNHAFSEAEVDEDGTIVFKIRVGNSAESFDLRLSPSELLYYHDRHGFVDALTTLKLSSESEEALDSEILEKEEEIAIKATVSGAFGKSHSTDTPPLKRISDYDGNFSNYSHQFFDYLSHHVLNTNELQASDIQDLTYTLLAEMDNLAVVDWDKRESTYTSVKVRIKKILRFFNIKKENIDGYSEKIIDWLSNYITGNNNYEYS